MTKTITELIAVRVKPSTKKKVERVARQTQRSQGAVVRVALEDWLRRQELKP